MTGVPWLILPTYNEAENIERILSAATDVLSQASPDGFQILVVDDSSPDGTGQIVDRLAQDSSYISVLHRTQKAGLGKAYIAGFKHALESGASYLFEMDSDFSHDPKDLKRLLERCLEGADLVLGSRYVDGGSVEDWGTLRLLVSRGGSLYARKVLGVQVKDLTGGFKCFRREVLENIDLDTVRGQGYVFQIELTYRALQSGFEVAEIPITFRDRTAGKSKMSWQIAAEAIWLVPSIRFRS